MIEFDETLVQVARWALALAAAWGLLIALALALELLTAGRVRSTWACPPALRRAALAGLGLLLSGGAAGLPAVAAPPRPGPPLGPVSASSAGLPVPGRPLGTVARDPATHVVVRRGDTLWDLAAAHLRAGASDADVARLVHRLHRLNRDVIGPDPDLIRPGERLLVTPPPPSTREDLP